MNAVSLFSGIGGFERALALAGVPTVASVEIDATCCAVLADRFPDAALFADVTEVTGDHLRAAGFVPDRGVLTAGWPCQDLSVAGRRAGLGGERSGLWAHVVRLLADLRPRWFIGENVPGLLSSNDGRDMGTVLWDLAELGYGFAYRVLDAQWFGVPQRRRRVFFVGRLGDGAAPVQVLLEPESGGGDSAPGRAAGTDVAGTLGSRVGGSRTTDLDGHGAYVAHALLALTESHRSSEDGTGRSTPLVPMAFNWQTGGDMRLGYGEAPTALQREQTPAVQTATAVRRLTPRECERLMGLPDDWTAGHSDSARYRMLGNSVVVPVVEWIARRILAADREVPRAAD